MFLWNNLRDLCMHLLELDTTWCLFIYQFTQSNNSTASYFVQVFLFYFASRRCCYWILLDLHSVSLAPLIANCSLGNALSSHCLWLSRICNHLLSLRRWESGPSSNNMSQTNQHHFLSMAAYISYQVVYWYSIQLDAESNSFISF